MRSVVGLGLVLSLTACGDDLVPPPTHEGEASIVVSGGVGRALVVTDRGLFWSTERDVMRLASTDDAPVVLASAPTGVTALCVTGSEVYFVTELVGRESNEILGGVFRVPLDGGALQTIHRPDAFGPGDIECDDDGVLWMQDWTEVTAQGLSTGLMSIDDTGKRIVFLEVQPIPGPTIAIDSGFVYWRRDFREVVRTSRSDAQQTESIASTQGLARSLEVSHGELLWIDPPSNSTDPAVVKSAALMSAPITGGPSRRRAELIEPTMLDFSIAADDKHIYWAEHHPGRIMRVARGGGDPEVFAADQSEPIGIAVFAGAVYWTNRGSGNLVVLATE